MLGMKKQVERTSCLAITHKGDACPATGYKKSQYCYGHWNQRIDNCRLSILDHTYDDMCEAVWHAIGTDIPDFVYAYLRELYSDPFYCSCGVQLFPNSAQFYSGAKYCLYCGVAFTQQMNDWVEHEKNRILGVQTKARLGR